MCGVSAYVKNAPYGLLDAAIRGTVLATVRTQKANGGDFWHILKKQEPLENVEKTHTEGDTPNGRRRLTKGLPGLRLKNEERCQMKNLNSR